VLRGFEDRVIPVPLDRDRAHLLTDIDDLLSMGTFADQVPSTGETRDIAPFDIAQDGFSGRESAVQIGKNRHVLHSKRLQEGGRRPRRRTPRHDRS
jgi:hypothetical protein